MHIFCEAFLTEMAIVFVDAHVSAFMVDVVVTVDERLVAVGASVLWCLLWVLCWY